MNRGSSFAGKKILIMGLGLHGGGIGAARYLARRGADILVTDLRRRSELKSSIEELKEIRKVKFVLGRHRRTDFLSADLIIKNPGIPPESLFLKIAEEHGIPITTDLAIFFSNCRGKIIGVTGTRGKSTTAHLIWKFLYGTGNGRVFLGGNIRKSALEFLDEVGENDLAVLELSSFQLEDLGHEKKSPHIAVFTNIYPDHLNRHKTVQEYAAAKSNIFKFQSANDLIFADRADAGVMCLLKHARAKIIYPRIPRVLRKIVDKNLGEHYASSVALARGVAKHFGVADSKIRKELLGFHGLEGRQEVIGSVSGIRFVNDTTSTIPEATVQALRRFSKIKKKSGRIILIAGGQDKKLDFGPFIAETEKFVSALILLPGSATEKLKKGLERAKYSVASAKSMKEAVYLASREAKKGDWVILSPGAASFGLFQNEFDRGKQFIDAVNSLKKQRHV